MTDYPQWRKDRCVHCAAGVPMGVPNHHWGVQGQCSLMEIPCTAPTKEQYIAELEARIKALEASEKIFRRLLWIAQSNGLGYGDDGELQHRGIDYKRMTAREIEGALFADACRQYKAERDAARATSEDKA